MTRTSVPPSARTTPSRRVRRLLAIGLVAVVAVIAAALGHRPQILSGSPGPTDSSGPSNSSGSLAAPPARSSSAAPPSKPRSAPSANARRGERRGAFGAADGIVPDRVTVFDDTVPAVADLDPELLEALRLAATDAAADDGVQFDVNSGRRSPRYQTRLFQEAVSTYGSEERAARWVATAVTSSHVSGDAVDIGPSAATTWLAGHGAAYGLCQIYENEPWHYELRARASDRGCPRRYADPTEDPRTRR